MKIKGFLIALFIFYSHFAYTYNYSWIQTLSDENTWINWTSYKIYSSVNGTTKEFYPPYPWIKEKKIQLMNKLYNATLNIELGNNYTLAKITNKEAKTLLWGLINNSSDNSIVKTSENSTKLILGIKITGEFLKKAIPMSFLLKTKGISPIKEKEEDFLKGYTGVIIQIDTEQFEPSLMIWIYSEDGEVLLSPNVMEYEYFVNNGMALFLKSPQKQLIEERIGPRPLTLQANSIYNHNKHSIMLNHDNSFYLKFKSILNLLKKGKLVIIKEQYTSYQENNVQEFKIND